MATGDYKPVNKLEVADATYNMDSANYTIGASVEAQSVKTDGFEIAANETVTCCLCGSKSVSDWMRVEKNFYCTKCLNKALSHGWAQANLELKKKKALQDVTRCQECLRRVLREHAWNLGSGDGKLVLCDACYLDLMDKAVEQRHAVAPRRNLVL